MQVLPCTRSYQCEPYIAMAAVPAAMIEFPRTMLCWNGDVIRILSPTVQAAPSPELRSMSMKPLPDPEIAQSCPTLLPFSGIAQYVVAQFAACPVSLIVNARCELLLSL